MLNNPVRFLLAILLAAPAGAAHLTALSIAPGTVTIAADAAVTSASVFALATPFRLVVDLPGSVSPVLVADGVGSVARLRAAMFDPATARLVIDLNGPLEVSAAETGPAGLVLKLRRVSEEAFAASVKRGRRSLLGTVAVAAAPADFSLPPGMFTGSPNARIAKPQPPPPMGAQLQPGQTPRPADDTESAVVQAFPDVPAAPTSSPTAAPLRSRSGGKPLVVIDAGHGGKDVGAISVDGAYEKDATLAIARATAAALIRHGLVRVKLTRDDDRFIPLGGRVAIARAARADLFVSVHADSAPNADARGASVYTLSAVASDAVAARLAARENKADIIGGINLGSQAPEVGDILIDLSRRATNNVSVAFAETLQDELSSRMNFRGEFHHFAGFYVLKAPDVPSVLLETGYVTNEEDAEILFSDKGRRRIGEGIARAIERHLVGGRVG